MSLTTAASRRTAAAILAALALAACGEAAGETTADADPEEAREVIEVVGVDYGFEGLPATAAAGTELVFRNDSEVEAHELILFKIADGEERPIPELLALEEAEGAEAVRFVGGSFALPGEEGTPIPSGESPLALAEPGRYALVCHFPIGADPEVLAEAMSGELEGKPDFGDGAPHFTAGMAAEITVE